MASVGLEVVLFLFGVIILCIGIFGHIDTQWFKIGSRSAVTRGVSVTVGALLIVLALVKAGVLPLGNARRFEQLTQQNDALRAQVAELERKLTRHQNSFAAYGGTLEQLRSESSTLENEAALRPVNEAVISLAERVAAGIAGIGDPTSLAKVDPSGETNSTDGDNLLANARALGLGERVVAEIRPYTDRDYYKVLTPSNVTGALRVILRKLDPQGLATQIVIYDQNERVIERHNSIMDPTASFSLRRPSGEHFYLHVASQGLPPIYSIKPQEGRYELVVRTE